MDLVRRFAYVAVFVFITKSGVKQVNDETFFGLLVI